MVIMCIYFDNKESIIQRCIIQSNKRTGLIRPWNLSANNPVTFEPLKLGKYVYKKKRLHIH